MKVLVTGGGGFLGSAIVERLQARGHEVRSISRGYYPKLARMGVEQVQGDIGNPSDVQRACQDREVVFHVASKFGIWGDYNDYYQTNVNGTRNIIDGCRAHKVARLVYTSTPNVIFSGRPEEGVNEATPYPARFPAHYPKTKALAEQQVVKAADDNLKTIVLRPHFMYGPGDNHGFPRIIARANRLKIIGDGKNLIDVTYIDDAVEAHLLAAEKLDQNPALSGKVYFISQGEPYPAWGMINNFLQAAGLNPIKRAVPHRVAWFAGACLELIYTLFKINGEPFMTRYLADICAASQWFDISAARKDLGFTPQVDVAEGFRRLEKWLKSQPAADQVSSE